DLGVPAHRDPLVTVVEVVVIVGQPDGQAADDKGRQVGSLLSPLLLSVALNQLFVDVPANQGNCLFFQVLRLLARHLLPLFIDFGKRLGRGPHPPHLVKGVHVKRQVVHLALVVGNGTVGVTVKVGKLVDVVPDFLVRSVKDVGAVLVDLDAVNFLGVDVSGNVGTLFNYLDVLAPLSRLISKGGPKQAGTDN